MGKVIVDKLKKEYTIEDSWVSFEIHPERPPEGESAEMRFGKVQYQQMMTSLRARGSEMGITFCERPLLANSRLAIEAAEYAREKGLHSEFGTKVFEAYFSNGRNIGELEVILDVASSVGLEREEVRRILKEETYAARRMQVAAEAAKLGIDTVPTFIINENNRLIGAEPIDAFRKLFTTLEK